MKTLGLRNVRGVSTLLGTMEMGRRVNYEDSKDMVEIFKAEGFLELDTAAMYSGGQTEKFLGQMPKSSWKAAGSRMATKVNPWDKKGLSADSIQEQMKNCLKRLNAESVDILYLHAPDHDTPLIETLKECNRLYQQGQFKELGLSNYSSWLVGEVYNICKQNNFVLPTVYQGMYSALTRQVEKELFPCLRYYNIRFYAYSPLGGGMLTGKWKFSDVDNQESQPNSRFFGKSPWCKTYRDRYWKIEYFDGIERLGQLLKEIYPDDTPTIPEASYRWLYHHSQLKDNDGVITGASGIQQLKDNLSYTKKEPLDVRVVEHFELMWKNTAHLCPEYFR